MKAISDLSESVNRRMDFFENNYVSHGVNAISSNRDNYNHRGNRYYRGRNNRGRFVKNAFSSNYRDNSNRYNRNDQSENVLRCHKCNGLNHFARDCRSKNF